TVRPARRSRPASAGGRAAGATIAGELFELSRPQGRAGRRSQSEDGPCRSTGRAAGAGEQRRGGPGEGDVAVAPQDLHLGAGAGMVGGAGGEGIGGFSPTPDVAGKTGRSATSPTALLRSRAPGHAPGCWDGLVRHPPGTPGPEAGVPTTTGGRPVLAMPS